MKAALPDLPFHLAPPEKKFTLDEAAAMIRDVQQRVMAVEEYRIRLNWCFGLVVVHTERPRGKRREIIEELAERVREAHNISVSTTLLYQCRRVYLLFDGKLDLFERWIRMNEAARGRPVSWRTVTDQLLGGRNNPAIIGREAADRYDLRDAEFGADAAERLIHRRSTLDEEVAGALEGIRQTFQGLLLLKEAPLPSVRDEGYRAYVRRYGCLACEHPAEAHHALGERGQSVKPSDYTCVPLCRAHHGESHRRGAQAFEEKYDVSFLEAAFNLFHRYATGRWLTMRLVKVR